MVITFDANQTYIKLSFEIWLQRQVSSRSLQFLIYHRQHWQFAGPDLAVHNINPVCVSHLACYCIAGGWPKQSLIDLPYMLIGNPKFGLYTLTWTPKKYKFWAFMLSFCIMLSIVIELVFFQDLY